MGKVDDTVSHHWRLSNASSDNACKGTAFKGKPPELGASLGIQSIECIIRKTSSKVYNVIDYSW